VNASDPVPPPCPLWGRMSTLWLLLVPCCVAVYSLLLPIAPNDFWYHLRAGAEICATGRIPATALFSSAATPGTPYFYQSWIAEVILFQVLKIGGLSAIEILRTACLTLAFLVLLVIAWRRVVRAAAGALQDTTRARIVALCSFLAFANSASNMDVRPQTFSVPLFCIFAGCLFEWPFFQPRHRTLVSALMTALMLLWANTHGAFFTGIVLLGVFAGGEVLYSSLARSEKFRHYCGEKLPTASLRAALVLFIFCVLATLFNPRGTGIYSYVWLLAHLQANQKFIQEWQAPSLTQWYGALFFFSLFLLMALGGVLLFQTLARTREKTSESNVVPIVQGMLGILGARFSEFLILGALAIMALRDIRSIIWFALFCAPVLAAMSTRLLAWRSSAPGRPAAGTPRAAQIANAIIALLLIVAFVPLLPRFKARLVLPPEYSSHFTRNPRGEFPVGFESDPQCLLERNTPVEAVEFLRANPPRGKIWNDFVYGSYLAWATLDNPRLAPFADPRVEMHPLAFWEEYGRIADGARDAAVALSSQGFSDALLDIKEEPALIRRLRQAGWKEIFRHQDTILLRRVQQKREIEKLK
jgi:hypothetical protein